MLECLFDACRLVFYILAALCFGVNAVSENFIPMAISAVVFLIAEDILLEMDNTIESKEIK